MHEAAPGSTQLDNVCAQVDALSERLAAALAERDRAVANALELKTWLDEAILVEVALERLHGALDRAEVLRAIQDVVINLVGSEELAVFEPGEGRDLLFAVQSFGVDRARLAPVRLGEGPVGRAAAEGRAWVAGDERPPGDPRLTACVPLLAEGRLMAVLAIWRLLEHKPGLSPADRRVLQLLGRHAGSALYLTSGRRGEAGAV
ncbi:MAG TPA: GAF domain-containing protein [Anaeromyxobacter sp.]|nr:GAF domain-containing protein [Anaeromyxobacter sp.]